MLNLCQYQNLFGVQNQGIHSYRIFNIAIVDLFLTILAAIIIGNYWHLMPNKLCNFSVILVLLLILSVIVHKLFCVQTTLTNYF